MKFKELYDIIKHSTIDEVNRKYNICYTSISAHKDCDSDRYYLILSAEYEPCIVFDINPDACKLIIADHVEIDFNNYDTIPPMTLPIFNTKDRKITEKYCLQTNMQKYFTDLINILAGYKCFYSIEVNDNDI
jgi:hypothetical protein